MFTIIAQHDFLHVSVEYAKWKFIKENDTDNKTTTTIVFFKFSTDNMT